MTPTARSLAYHRELGHEADVVERFIRIPKGRAFRKDLFGFADLLVLDGFPGSLAVQACVTGDQTKRLQKINLEPRARRWVAAGNRIAVEGWALRGPRGARKRWTPSITHVVFPTDLPSVVVVREPCERTS